MTTEQIITIRDIYDGQQALSGKVDSVSVQVTEFTATVRTQLEYTGRDLADLQTRVRALEAFRWKLAGAALVVGAAAGAAAGWVALVVSHH